MGLRGDNESEISDMISYAGVTDEYLQFGSDDRKIFSNYLETQEENTEAQQYRDYLQSTEVINAARRKRLFRQKEAYEEGRTKFDFSRYKKRQCFYGIPSKNDPLKCGCGELLSDPKHEKFPSSAIPGVEGGVSGEGRGETEEEEIPWSYTTCTKLLDTDAYGRVWFANNQRGKYIRIDTDTASSELSDLFTKVYNLSTPGVIMSVLGSLLDFNVSPALEKIIQRGIVKAAITTNGWITTFGYNAGYCKLIGEAMKINNSAVPCIGFCSWGCLPPEAKEKMCIPKKKRKDQQAREYSCKYPRINIPPKSAYENLEPNHSHYVLSDTGKLYDWGNESYLRTAWEAYMKNEHKIPAVMIVIQGGTGVCRALYEGLKSGTPAVLIFGSGGVCDAVVELVRHFNSSWKTIANNSICQCDGELSMSCSSVLEILRKRGKFSKQCIEDASFLRRLKNIVQRYTDLLVIYDMHDDVYDGVDAALLEALIKVKDAGSDDDDDEKLHISGVQVALDWNRPDFAKKILSTSDKEASDKNALGSLLIHALAWNLHEFARLLMDHGANIPMVSANVLILYNSSNNIDHIKRYVHYALGIAKPASADSMFDKRVVDKMINALSGKELRFNSNVANENDPYFELMVWAALCLYPEIAEMMWRGTQDPIRSALFVVLLLNNLSNSPKAISNSNEKELIESITTRFEELAIEILNNLHDHCDRAVRDRAINSCWVRFNNLNFLDIAFYCKAKRFIAHPACQDIVERRWKRGLTSDVNVLLAMLITICPFLLFTRLVTYRTDWVKPGNKGSRVRFVWNRIVAYCISPSVKFAMFVECYVAFVLLQTYVILAKISRERHETSAAEIIYFTWFILIIIDELQQAIVARNLHRWWRRIWNKIDFLMYLLTIAGLILVHIPQTTETKPEVYNEKCYNAGRIVLSISSTIFIIRMTQMFVSDSQLGPTILMIRKMFQDFKVFLFLLAIVAFAFGTGYAICLTDPTDIPRKETANVISGILYYPFFQMFGELFVDELGDVNGTTFFPGTNKSKERASFAIVLAAIYLSIMVLMFVNILIAMFSDTYTRIKDKEDVIFKSQKLELLLEMEDSLLPPPFSFIHFISSLLMKRKQKIKIKEQSDSILEENKWHDTIIRSALVDCLEEYLKKEKAKQNVTSDIQIRESARNFNHKLKSIESELATLKDVIISTQSTKSNVTDLV